MFRRAIHIYKYIRTTNGARLFLKKCAHHRLRRRVYKRLGSGAEVRLFARVCARVSGRRVAAASRRRVQRIKEPGGPDARQPGGRAHKLNDTPPKNPPVFLFCIMHRRPTPPPPPSAPFFARLNAHRTAALKTCPTRKRRTKRHPPAVKACFVSKYVYVGKYF